MKNTVCSIICEILSNIQTPVRKDYRNIDILHSIECPKYLKLLDENGLLLNNNYTCGHLH